MIDILGATEFNRRLSILQPGGKLLSLRTGPNKRFSIDYGLSKWKQLLFGLAGAKFDRKAKKVGGKYRFIFVRADGNQLKELRKIIEIVHIVPEISYTEFSIETINDALGLVANGHPKGKVVIE